MPVQVRGLSTSRLGWFLVVEQRVHRDFQLRTEKTGVSVKVELPAVVANALRPIKKASPGYFFWLGKSRLASVTDLWRSRLRPVFEEAGIKDAHSHRFRDTFAVALLEAGESATTVAALLGNTEKIVIKHYSPWVESRQKGLDEAVRRANGYQDIKPVVVAKK